MQLKSDAFLSLAALFGKATMAMPLRGCIASMFVVQEMK